MVFIRIDFCSLLMVRAGLVFLIILSLVVLSVQAGEVFSTREFPKTDFTKHSVPLSEIYSGGPPRDGIKPIDKPTFVSVTQARDYLDEREPVVVVNVSNQTKAYPLRILLYHEIVNDVIGGQPVLITHCPLCNTAIVFSRKIGNEILDFGTTGRVRDSNLVMYDRQTESWWQQFTGDAIVGKYSGSLLEPLNSQIASYAQFSKNYPTGLVLSQDTGFQRYYGETPYPGYDNLSKIPFLFKREIDFRLPPLERVLALVSDSNSTIYPFSYLNKNPLINTSFEGRPILVISQASMFSTVDKKIIKDSNIMLTAAAFDRKVNGNNLKFQLNNDGIFDIQTQSEWNIFGEAVKGALKGTKLKQVDKNVHFAFAWLAFFPNAEIINE